MAKEFKLNQELKKSNNLPLLTEDQQWLYFFQNSNNLKIKYNYSALKKLLSEKEKAEKEIIVLKKEKKKDMDRIISLSQKVNNEGGDIALEKMDQLQKNIRSFNEKIDKLEIQVHRLKEKIVNVNFALLEETVKVAYKEIKKQEKLLEEVEEEIKSLKDRLTRTINKKYNIEEQKTRIYRLIHSLLGVDQTDKLDKDYLDE